MQNYITPTSTDTFIAMFTHDLKTPINSGIMALELLLQGCKSKLSSNEQEMLNDVLNTTKYLKSMTDNVLCKYKTESGNLKLKKEICSLKDLVIKSIEETKYVLNDKNQTIALICPQQDTFVSIDKIEMQRVINNLISNASSYSPKNSEIIISIIKSDDKINFSIQDFGQGIALKKLNKVFEEYVSIAEKEKKTSTGLGLYITKLIIDAHCGNIDIKSKKGQGTTISFNLPL